MSFPRFSRAAVACATALALTATALPAEAGTVVEVNRNGSSGFDFNSSGKDAEGKPVNNSVNSSRNGFFSSTNGDEKKPEQEKKGSSDLGNSSGDNSVLTGILVALGVITIFAAGYNFAVANHLLPR